MKYNQPVIILVLHIFVANGTETIAVPQGDGSTYRLFGYKWFSSATDADMTLTLARIQNPNGTTQPVSIASAYPRSQQVLFFNCLRLADLTVTFATKCTLFAPQNFAQAFFSISLGTAVIPRRNEKQRLSKISVDKQGVFWEMCFLLA